VAALAGGVTVGYLFLGLLPAIVLSAPDDSSVLISRYSLRMRQKGKGLEAVALAMLGTMIGLLFVCVLILPYIWKISCLFKVIQPNLHWLLLSTVVLLFLHLLSDTDNQEERRLSLAGTSVGLLTIILSGIMGCYAFSVWSPVPGQLYVSMLPLIAGLFAAPSLLINCIFKHPIPAQNSAFCGIKRKDIMFASLSGIFWGLMSTVLTLGSAGVGSILADKSAKTGDNVGLVVQGVVRAVYFCVMVLTLIAGVCPALSYPAASLSVQFMSMKGEPLFLAGACLLLPALVAIAVLYALLVKWHVFARHLEICKISHLGLISIVVLVLVSGGPSCLALFLVSAAIGMLPSLFGINRLYCLAGLLVYGYMGIA